MGAAAGVFLEGYFQIIHHKENQSAHMDEKRKKNHCYHCEEKWSLAHICKNPRIYLLQGSEEVSDKNEENHAHEREGVKKIMIPANTIEEYEISLATIEVTPKPKTMRIVGNILGGVGGNFGGFEKYSQLS